MTIADIIYALHEQIITRDEARRLIDALAHMELSVGLEVGDTRTVTLTSRHDMERHTHRPDTSTLRYQK